MSEGYSIEPVVVHMTWEELLTPAPYDGLWREVDGREAPSREFYDIEPRATEIRDVCVRLTTGLARLLWDRTLSNGARVAIEAEIKDSGGQLVSLGITPDMNTDLNRHKYRRYPIVFAEYVAGQLLLYSGVRVRSEGSLQPLMQEFSHEAGLIENEDTLPEDIEGFFVSGWIVKNAMDFLDCEAEVRAQLTLQD